MTFLQFKPLSQVKVYFVLLIAQMLVKEYRVPIPLTVEEYHIGQLWSVAEASKRETGNGEGIEILINEPYELPSDGTMPSEFVAMPKNADGKVDLEGKRTGQYTHKIYHLSSKVPAFVRVLVPSGLMQLHERAWNAYPDCKTVYSLPFMKDSFMLMLESRHLQGPPTLPNVHQLDQQRLIQRQVVVIDIVKDPLENPKDYKETEDPSKVHSEKTGRGPLAENWIETSEPIMTAYKLISVDIKIWGLQSKLESWVQKLEFNLLLKFHRQLFCWLDKWFGLSIQDIRDIEERTKAELDLKRKSSGASGTRK